MFGVSIPLYIPKSRFVVVLPADGIHSLRKGTPGMNMLLKRSICGEKAIPVEWTARIAQFHELKSGLIQAITYEIRGTDES
jgi:hypothetical protein